jgi:hypothetical protein
MREWVPSTIFLRTFTGWRSPVTSDSTPQAPITR